MPDSAQEMLQPVDRWSVWSRLKRHRPAYFCIWLLLILALLALLAPLLANERPLCMKYKGQWFFPAFSTTPGYDIIGKDGTPEERIQPNIADWKHMHFDFVIWPPVVYSAGKADEANMQLTSPFGRQFFADSNGRLGAMPWRFRHFLGTNSRGEDLLAGLLYGARISMSIGFLAMGIAAIIGLLLGSLAGYFGNDGLLMRRGMWVGLFPGLLLGCYYAFVARHYALQDALAESGFSFLRSMGLSLLLLCGVMLPFIFIGKLLSGTGWGKAQRAIPADALVSRLIEILNSLPLLILIISLASIARPSLLNLMVLIGLTGWSGIARLTRAEMLKIRRLDYIRAAHALGYTPARIVLRHALPNGIAPALVSIAFGVAGAILVESALSFLGIGVPPEIVTWGSLLNAAQGNFSAWWLILFPGLAIFVTVVSYNLIGEGLRDALDPRTQVRPGW